MSLQPLQIGLDLGVDESFSVVTCGRCRAVVARGPASDREMRVALDRHYRAEHGGNYVCLDGPSREQLRAAREGRP